MVKGMPSSIEAVIFAWLITPIGIAYFLARTGRYELAHGLSALALAGLVTVISLMSGGVYSPAVIWLPLIPFEAALCASRRVMLLAIGVASAAVGLLIASEVGGLGLAVARPEISTAILAGLSVTSALAYAAVLACGTQFLARTNSDRLSLEEERYRLLALNMSDVITRHGRNGIALFVSPAGEKLLGASVGELAGHGLFDRVHVGDRPAYLTALGDAAASAEPRSVEFRIRRNGFLSDTREAPQFIWVEMRCRSLASATLHGDGNPEREVVGVLRDVTKRKEQERALEEARSDAENANAAKGRFLATMSHELRTPLNAVIGFSEMLMNETSMSLDAPRRHEYACLIHDSGHHLLSVVNLVLDMSKIETGNFVITPEPFAPAPVIRSCCDLLALKACESKLNIVVRITGDLPEINADKRALKQMLLNLLSNAVKFTGVGGQVVVSAALDGARISIAVQDTGVGIGPDDLPRIGDPFFQARGASYDRPYEGTGLGLSIVKGLVELHGGEMRVESSLGVGTCVTIRLPLDCEATPRDQGASVIALTGDPKAEASAASTDTPAWSESQVRKRA